MLHVQPLREPLVDQTARLLARAMDVDAAYRYLFPEPAERAKGLARLFEGNLRIHLAHACCHVAVEAGRVVATVTLRPPGGIDISPWAMLRAGLLPFFSAHGMGAVRRLLWLKRHYDALEDELSEHRPHFYVHMMAVLPERQGLGVGRQLLDQVLVASADHCALLTTHSQRNVAFYRRAGFELVWQKQVRPPCGEPYPVWGMR